MDMGIIATTKRLYRGKLLAIRTSTMSNTQLLRAQAEARKINAGTKGLAEGYKPHLRDAAELLCEAWDAISQDAIAR